MKNRATNINNQHVHHDVIVSLNCNGCFVTNTNGEFRTHHNSYDLMKFLSIAVDGKWLGRQTYHFVKNDWVKTTEDLIPINK